MIINRKSRFEKISSKNYPYGDFDENLKKLVGRLRVKLCSQIPKFQVKFCVAKTKMPCERKLRLSFVLHNVVLAVSL